ncbi:MAG: helix-turn-helix transcriptional regulator [Bacillota bacterium]
MIKQLRQEKGLTQETLAKELNITLRHFQNIENGKTTPSVIIGLKIAKILGCDPYDLFIIDKN